MKGNTRVKFLAYLILFCTTFREVHSCKHGWLQIGTYCLRVFDDQVMLLSARNLCMWEGSRLLDIPNKRVLNYLAKQLLQNQDERFGTRFFWTEIQYSRIRGATLKLLDGSAVTFRGSMFFPRCLGFDPRTEGFIGLRCNIPLQYICGHEEKYGSNGTCNEKVNTESFIGEDTGNCLFETPGETTKDKVEELCTQYEGHFVDLDNILKDGIINFYYNQVLAGDGSRYWTNITWNGTSPIWDNPLKDDIYANEVFFTKGTGSCTTVEFNIMDVLETHLYQTECDSTAKVVCSKPTDLSEYSSTTKTLNTQSTSGGNSEFFTPIEIFETDTTVQEGSEFSTTLRMSQTDTTLLETSEFSTTIDVSQTDTTVQDAKEFSTSTEVTETTNMPETSEVTSSSEISQNGKSPEARELSTTFKEIQTATTVQENSNYSTPTEKYQSVKTMLTSNEPPLTTEKIILNCARGHYFMTNRTTKNCFWNASMAVKLSSWEDGEKYCWSVGGGHLPSFHSEEEEMFGLNFMTEGLSGPYWIGLKLDPENETYRWSDGTPLDYSNWAPGHPNHKDKRLRCVAMITKDKHWVSAVCRSKIRFICKISNTLRPPNSDFSTTVPGPSTSGAPTSATGVEEQPNGLSTRTLVALSIFIAILFLSIVIALIYFHKRSTGRLRFGRSLLHRNDSGQNILYKVMSEDMEFEENKDL